MKNTILSLIRHVFTFVGGILLAKGYLSSSVVEWLPGAGFVLAGGIWGAIDELKATKQKLHFWLSIARHVLTAVGGFFAASGKISLDTVETLIGALITIAGTIWGTGDEFKYASEHPKSN